MRFGLTGIALGGMLLAPALAMAQAPQRAAPSRPANTTQQRPPVTTPPRQAGPQALHIPSAQALIILIKSSLIALNQANQTGVYHVFYGLGSDSFRTAQTPDRLAQSFAGFRTNNIDLSPIIYLNPQLARQPVIEQNKLRLVGFFPTSPTRVNFDLVFEPSQGRWKMAQVNVGLARAPAQAAPQPSTQPQGQSRLPAQLGPQPRN